MVGLLAGLAAIALVVVCAAALRRLDETPRDEQIPEPVVTPVLRYTPRSFSQPAVKGFSRGIARFQRRGNDAA
jgi:hypothetical protein